MNTKEFKKNYIEHYLLLEKDFKETFDYVSVEPDNYKTYSPIYLKVLLSIGSEIDIMKNFLAKQLDSNFSGEEAHKVILSKDKNFKELEVKLLSDNTIIKPWHYNKEPDWWTIYNEVKHNRLEPASKFDSNRKYYQYANLENVLYALAALYSLEMYSYRLISQKYNENPFLPIIKTIFCMNNSFWAGIKHGDGVVVINQSLYLPE